MNESARNSATKEGQQYRERFEQAILPTFAKALHSCLSRPDTVEPAMIVFIISADGRVKKILASPNIEYGRCVVSELRLPKVLPKPPHDSWPVAEGPGKPQPRREEEAGPSEKPIPTEGEGYDRGIQLRCAGACYVPPAAKKRFLAGLPPEPYLCRLDSTVAEG